MVMEGEYKVWPAWPGESAMRSGLPLDAPSGAQQGRQHALGFGGRPLAHAAMNESLSISGAASPCSNRSAMTRKARA